MSENPINAEQLIKIFDSQIPFVQLMNYYRCAIMEVETKLNVLNAEFSMQYDRNPIETIKTRLKSPVSIYEKTKRKGIPFNASAIEQSIFDIAGIRVVCSFIEDIYKIAEYLTKQDDIRVINIKDYIQSPKESGYRSLHVILEIPIFLSNQKRWTKVEVQFRTIAMDFWASVEHKLRYKKNIKNPELIAGRLKEYAEIITHVDMGMQEIRSQIDSAETFDDDE